MNKTSENAKGRRMFLAICDFLIRKYAPNIEITDTIAILNVERMQLKISIFTDKSADKFGNVAPARHCVTLFPPKNCNAPKMPPL